MVKVYVSATYNDLKDYRAKVYDALRSMPCDVIAMEDGVAQPERPLEICLADVESCEVYIGIFAWRYGSIPPYRNPGKLSITEHEYNHAKSRYIPTLIFLLDESFPWPPRLTDSHTGENSAGARIRKLRDTLCRENYVAFFTSPDDLATKVLAAVHRWQERSRSRSLSTNVQPWQQLHGCFDDTLSRIPRSYRPAADNALVGRTDDLRWLSDTQGDRLLVGQPGSGKTFLLRKLVEQGEALFLVGSDETRIGHAISAYKPRVVIVDDAVADLRNARDTLSTLYHIRSSRDYAFTIVAACWPHDEAAVAYSMLLPASRIRRLALLTRDEIAEILRRAGFQGPGWILQEIIDQAEGLPGLAITLAHLCAEGDVRGVIRGEALLRHVNVALSRHVGQHDSVLLAMLSLSGDIGMTMESIARSLGQDPERVREAMVNTGAAGVIEQVGEKRVRVRPARLRAALVRDVFYGPHPLNMGTLIPGDADPEQLALTLVEAARIGAAIPGSTLWPMVCAAASPVALERYAWLGPTEVRQVIDLTGRMSNHVTRAALEHIPRDAIRTLLEEAVGDNRALAPNPEAPLRILDDWIREVWPGTEETIGRRVLLLDALTDWATSPLMDSHVIARALRTVFSPNFSISEPEPGSGLRVNLTWGWLTTPDVDQLRNLWPRALSLLSTAGITDWATVMALVEDWAHPVSSGLSPEPDLRATLSAGARQMLHDIVSLAHGRPMVLRWSLTVAEHLGISLNVSLDQDFATLYPLEDRREWHVQEQQLAAAARDLGLSWADQEPANLAGRLRWIEDEASHVERPWPRLTPLACRALSSVVPVCTPWVMAFVDAGLPADLVFTFLVRAAAHDEEGWESLAWTMLADDRYAGAAIQVVLSLSKPPCDLLDAVAAKLLGFEHLVEAMALRGEMSEFVVARLLDCAPPTAAAAVALGEWLCEPEGSVRAPLRVQWRNAIVRLEEDFRLSQVLATDEELALDWLKLRLSEDRFPFWRYDESLEATGKVLSTGAKSALLDELPLHYNTEIVTYYLLRSDPLAYEVLLRNERLKPCHLFPLSGRPEGEWAENAVRALEAGYTPTDVAAAAFVGPTMLTVSWSGDESALWQEWIESFTQLGGHQDPRLREVAKVGIDIAAKRRDRALREERHEAIYGIG